MNTQNITHEIETITAEKAAELMSNNIQNRPLSSWRVREYVDLMNAGKFLFNGETIKVSVTGKLIDGQHRLAAIIQSRKAQKMLVVRGLSEDVIPTLDTGRTRTAADVLAVTSTTSTHDARFIAAAVKGLVRYEQGGNWLAVRGGSTRRLATNQIVAEYTKSHTQELTGNLAWIKSNLDKRGLPMGTGETLFFLTVFNRIDDAAGAAFIRQAIGGQDLQRDTTENTLNKHLAAVKAKTLAQNQAQVRHAVIKAWNATRAGKLIKAPAAMMPKESDPNIAV